MSGMLFVDSYHIWRNAFHLLIIDLFIMLHAIVDYRHWVVPDVRFIIYGGLYIVHATISICCVSWSQSSWNHHVCDVSSTLLLAIFSVPSIAAFILEDGELHPVMTLVLRILFRFVDIKRVRFASVLIFFWFQCIAASMAGVDIVFHIDQVSFIESFCAKIGFRAPVQNASPVSLIQVW